MSVRTLLLVCTLGLVITAVGCSGGSGATTTEIPVITTSDQLERTALRAEELSAEPVKRFLAGEEISDHDKDALREASGQLEGIVAYQPEQFTTHLGLGIIYRALGEDLKAETSLHRCIETASQRRNAVSLQTAAEATYHLSLIYFDSKDFKAAAEAANRAANTFPENPDYLVARASANIQLEKLAQARKDVNTALKLKPDHKRANGLKKLLDNVGA